MQPIVSWAPISFGSSVAFDVVILLLTLARIRADRILTSKIGRQIYHDSLVYFVATAVTNITVLSIQALGHEYDMIKPAAVPFSTVITASTTFSWTSLTYADNFSGSYGGTCLPELEALSPETTA